MKFSTQAIHSGQDPDPTTGATIPPIFQTSTYTQLGIGKHRGYEYSRTGNPTRTALEKCLASLEGARFGLAFASGMAAEDAVFSLLKPGDHVAAGSDLYGGTRRLAEKVYVPKGIKTSYTQGGQARDFEKILTPKTKLVWVESPTNPLLRLIDLKALGVLCAKKKILLVVDNTFATPFFQNPLSFKAHLVVHSTTKYINGHSDVVGGAILTNEEALYERLKFHQNAAGAVPGPFDCWLVLRGLKTLAVRMRQHEKNALVLAQRLSKHPSVTAVYYPGLPSHPQHKLASRQMSGFGGMITFRLKPARVTAESFVTRLKIFSFAESLGGVESLACHPASMTHASVPKEIREKQGIDDGLIRLSVGLEDVEDLWEDLENALLPTKKGSFLNL
jgi:cystathionine gamma-synthase/cystathionine gamma-lyase